MSFMNIDIIILIKVLASWIQQCINMILHHDQVGFISGIQGSLTFENVDIVYPINRIKEKKYMVA